MDQLIAKEDIVTGIATAFIVGFSFLLIHTAFHKSLPSKEGALTRLFIELRRKSFHMIGGGLICSSYYWGMEYGWLSSAYLAETNLSDPNGPLDAGAAFLSMSFVAWLWDFSRLNIPAIQRWYLTSFEGLVRAKEFQKAAGISYFLPGALAAMLAAPPNVAILGILYLSIGDAAASLGTAVGRIPVGTSPRRVEGSIGCVLVCWAVGALVGLPTNIALTSAVLVSVGEVLAEVIGLDDNLVLPMLGVMGVRIALAPRFLELSIVMIAGFTGSTLLGLLVVSGRPKKPVKSAK